jgi:hypothetical protein
MVAVRSDVRRGLAVEWLVQHIEAVDPEGQPIDSALLEEAPEPETDDAAGTEDLAMSAAPAAATADE